MTDTNPYREDIHRIVIKVGTNTLCDPSGRPDAGFLRELANDVHRIRSHGKEVLIVTSGAIGCGMHTMKMRDRPQDVAARQALAAIGQHRLMGAWQEAFASHNTCVAQVLVTHHTFDKRRSYLNLRRCLEQLVSMGAIPILNENDAVSVQEIDATFGDNDRLGALVAAKVEADAYLILSDVDGLYNKPPHIRGAKLVERVEHVTDDVLAMAGDRPGRGATGGMGSKLQAAKSLTEAGVPVVIAYGRTPGIISKLMTKDPEASDGDAARDEHAPRPGTWFEAVGHQDGRERWLAAAHPEGQILIDAGAAKALREGFHLLPAGVTGVEGGFPVESVVEIVHEGRVVAKAVSHMSSRDLLVCKGMQSEDAKASLGLDAPANITRKGRIVLS